MDNAFTLDFPCGWRTSKFPRGGMTWPKIDIENQLTGGLHAPVDGRCPSMNGATGCNAGSTRESLAPHVTKNELSQVVMNPVVAGLATWWTGRR